MGMLKILLYIYVCVYIYIHICIYIYQRINKNIILKGSWIVFLRNIMCILHAHEHTHTHTHTTHYFESYSI
jgi:F0F1-type ATP synthase assembly protein I